MAIPVYIRRGFPLTRGLISPTPGRAALRRTPNVLLEPGRCPFWWHQFVQQSKSSCFATLRLGPISHRSLRNAVIGLDNSSRASADAIDDFGVTKYPRPI